MALAYYPLTSTGTRTIYMGRDYGLNWHNLTLDVARDCGCTPDEVDAFDIQFGDGNGADVVLARGEFVGTVDYELTDDELRQARAELERLAEVEAYRRAAQ